MKTFRSDGLRGFYRGLSVPLAGTMLETAALFTINTKVKLALTAPQDYDRLLGMDKVVIAGGVTGVCVCVCVLRGCGCM